jgi:hypothetical protein
MLGILEAINLRLYENTNYYFTLRRTNFFNSCDISPDLNPNIILSNLQ